MTGSLVWHVGNTPCSQVLLFFQSLRSSNPSGDTTFHLSSTVRLKSFVFDVVQVTIYRLVTKGTYEEQLLNSANRKYGLNEAILGNINTASNPEDNAKRIAELLKNGAYSIMGDADAAEKEADEFEKADINDILSRRTTKRNIANKAGNSFSVATFNSNTTGGTDKVRMHVHPSYY